MKSEERILEILDAMSHAALDQLALESKARGDGGVYGAVMGARAEGIEQAVKDGSYRRDLLAMLPGRPRPAESLIQVPTQAGEPLVEILPHGDRRAATAKEVRAAELPEPLPEPPEPLPASTIKLCACCARCFSYCLCLDDCKDMRIPEYSDWRCLDCKDHQ